MALVTAGQPPLTAYLRRPRRAPTSASVPSSAVFARRRLLVAALAALTVLGVGRTAGSDTAGSRAVRPPVNYVVQPGDTLWSIAAVHYGRSSPEAVDRLVQLNGGSQLDVGQVIVLP